MNTPSPTSQVAYLSIRYICKEAVVSKGEAADQPDPPFVRILPARAMQPDPQR